MDGLLVIKMSSYLLFLSGLTHISFNVLAELFLISALMRV